MKRSIPTFLLYFLYPCLIISHNNKVYFFFLLNTYTKAPTIATPTAPTYIIVLSLDCELSFTVSSPSDTSFEKPYILISLVFESYV